MQNDSDNESLENSSNEDDNVAMLTRNYKKFLRRQNFHKKYEGRQTKEVTCYECKKPGHIKSDCPKLKSKNKGANYKKKAFKATWDDISESEMEEDEVANLCFMALEDDIEVPSTSYSSFDND